MADTRYVVLLHFSLSVKAVTLIFISGRDLAISSTHEGKTGNINGKTENFNCLLRVRIVLSRKIRSVLDEYTTFKFQHCEFNPQQGRLYFLFKIIIYFYFFQTFFTFVLERSFIFNNIYSRFIFFKVLEHVQYDSLVDSAVYHPWCCHDET